MKRLRLIIIVVVLIGSFSFLNVVHAEENVKVTYNGQEVAFDVNPTIENGRTLVPFRKIFEVLGAGVSWNASTSTVTAKNRSTEIVLTIGSKYVTVNGQQRILDVAPIIQNGRTIVHLRFVSENCGESVTWNGTPIHGDYD